jgi:hypothetical protein
MIKERFDALPQMIQEVILSSHYEETLLEIGKQYNLNVEQMGMLEQETTLTMMGLTPTKDFEAELTHGLNVNKLKGSQIAEDINEKIFLKIRELLKLMNTPAGEEPNLEETGEMHLPRPSATPQEGNKHDTKEEKKNMQVLNSAGIKIIPAQNEFYSGGEPDLTIPELKEGDKQEKSASTQGGAETPSISAQKLSGPLKTPIVETEHSLENITKTPPAFYPPKEDPYRLPPE